MSLEPCPSSPNCVCSQGDPTDTQHYIEPISYDGESSAALDAIAAAVADTAGATVTNRSDDQLDAVFVTRFFRFKDDVSFLIDTADQKIHLRSASRVGHSDLGANRKRMAALIPQIKAKL